LPNASCINDNEEKLLTAMRSRTWNALLQARQLRIELEEGIFINTVETALAEGEIAITTVPIQPLPKQPVRLEVKFNNNALNTCAARNEFVCVWDFGKFGKEEGWQISHYFSKDDDNQFSISFRKSDGTMVEKADRKEGNKSIIATHHIELQKPKVKKQSGERAKIERIQLGVALLIAVFGLLAGAREQLMKLDVVSGLIGVFLLGFGADTVKNLITKQSQEAVE